MTVRLIPSINPSDPRDRGYVIAVHDESESSNPRKRWFATTTLRPAGWRGRYGATAELAERRLRDWIEAAG